MLRIATWLCLAIVTSCVMIPAPQPEPYEKHLIDKLTAQISTKSDVENLLGESQVQRSGGDIWIYGETRRIGYLATYDGWAGPITDYQFLVLHFDNNNLQSIELVEDGNGCSEEGICVSSGWIATEEGHLELISEATIVNSRGNFRPELVKIPKSHCQLYVYNTTPSVGKLAWQFQVNKVNLSPLIDSAAYLSILLAAGHHELIISLPKLRTVTPTLYYTAYNFREKSSSVDFYCRGGEGLFLEVGVDVSFETIRGKSSPRRATKAKAKSIDIAERTHLEWSRAINAKAQSRDIAEREIAKRKLLLLH